MGEIADDLIQAQIMYPGMDPTDAYTRYIHDLASRGTPVRAKKKSAKGPKKGKKKKGKK